MSPGTATAISGGVGALGSLFQGVAGYQAGEQNAAALRVSAINAERTGAAEEARVRDSVRSAVGGQVAAQFSNGMLGGTGSAIDAVHDSLAQGALDALNVRAQAAAKAQAYETQADMAVTQGRNSLISGFLGAGAKIYQQRADWTAARRGIVSDVDTTIANHPGIF